MGAFSKWLENLTWEEHLPKITLLIFVMSPATESNARDCSTEAAFSNRFYHQNYLDFQ
jgi:hypothetical protein